MFDNFLTSKMEGLSGFTNQEDFFAQTSPEFCAAIDAMHAKLIIQRMSQVLGNPEFNNQIVQYVINDALRLGGILERIHVRPYEPIVKAELSRRKKRGERRKQETILTDRQWNLVKDFISRRTVGGVSAAKACSQASAQLSTGTFPKLKGKRIEISPKSLQNLWSNRNK
jgi:hypothetical protein